MTIEGEGDLDKRLAAIGDMRKMLGRLALAAVALAKQKVPRKTGNLGRTIRLGQVTETEAQILAGGQYGVGYAGAVEYGTRPHDIVPRYKMALAWPATRADARLSGSVRKGGKTIVRRRVHHPGTKAQPYLVPAAHEAVEKNGVDVIVKAWNEAA